MIYELNIYNYENGVKSVINPKRIFIEVNKTKLKKLNSINVRKQNIKVSENFFVAFEAVQVLENNWGIWFKASCISKELFLTKDSNGNWKNEEELNPSIWCKMNCIKN